MIQSSVDKMLIMILLLTTTTMHLDKALTRQQETLNGTIVLGMKILSAEMRAMAGKQETYVIILATGLQAMVSALNSIIMAQTQHMNKMIQT